MNQVNNTNPFASLTAANYGRALARLLPPGAALGGPNIQALLSAFAAMFGSFQARASQLSERELSPETTVELMPVWLADWGLPDCCLPQGATLQQEREQLLAKIAAVGYADANYYIAIAAALGWTITITEGTAGSFTWTINAHRVAPVQVFRAGENRAGDLLEQFAHNTELECVMNRIKPAHTVLIFSYT